MGLQRLSSRAIIGEFYLRLEQSTGVPWVNAISQLFDSDQAGEEYPWLSQAPAMREWIGGRHAKGFQENGILLQNKHFEATVDILVAWLRRDKTGQAMMRINELVERTNAHWAVLLSMLIAAGDTGIGYDGVSYFNTDHPRQDTEGKENALTQSNQITLSIADLPVQIGGTPDAPSVETMQQAMMEGIAQILGFLDDQGEPMNELASNFIVKVPTSLYIPATNAVLMPRETGVTAQRIPPNLTISVAANARLRAWTDRIAVIRADDNASAFIRQQETDVDMKAKAEGSDYEFDHDAHQYGVDTWRNATYGRWEQACQVILTA